MAGKRPDVNGSIDPGVIREFRQVYMSLGLLTQCMEEWNNMGVIVTEMRVRGPELTGSGFMVVVKCIDEGRRPYVAFRSGATLAEVMNKVAWDIEHDTLKLKEEQPYDPEKARKGP